MSRQILEKILAAHNSASEFNYHNFLGAGVSQLIDEIRCEVEKPEPEPFGFINPEHIQYNSCRIWKNAGCNGINLPLYTTPPDQSKKIAELEQQLANKKPVLLIDERLYQIADHIYYTAMEKFGKIKRAELRETILAAQQEILKANGFDGGDL